MTSPTSLEARVAHVEGIVDEMRARMAGVEERIASLDVRLNERMNRVEDRIARVEDKLQSNFRWTVGIMLGVMIPMWMTIILAILLRT